MSTQATLLVNQGAWNVGKPGEIIQAAISFNNEDVQVGAIKTARAKNELPEAVRFREWGKKNDLPQKREQLVNENNIVPALLQTKRDIILGTGLMAYTEKYVEGERVTEEVPMPTQMADFFEKVNIDRVMEAGARELLIHANIFPEYATDRAGRIIDMKVHRCAYIRAGEKGEDDQVPHWYLSSGWAISRKEEKDKVIKKIPAKTKDKQVGNYLLHLYDDLCRLDDYYYSPSWWGGWQWVDLANTIPQFHRSNLQHGYTIRYHIELPDDYFADDSMVDQEPEDLDKKNDVKAAKISEFLDHVNDFLAGADQAGRSIITTYQVVNGKEIAGVKINKVEVDLHDEALIKLFEASNQANISGQGIHPTLAAIETQGKLSSGSEIRNAFMMYLAIKAPRPRAILLRMLEPVYKANGWDRSIKLGFRDIQLTTLDESKTGTVETGTVTA